MKYTTTIKDLFEIPIWPSFQFLLCLFLVCGWGPGGGGEGDNPFKRTCCTLQGWVFSTTKFLSGSIIRKFSNVYPTSHFKH